MRLIKSLIVICTLTISGVFINSCCEGYFYKWTYILTDYLKRKEITYLDSIPKEEFGIRVHLFDRKYASNLQGLMINQTYAFDCEEYYIKEDSIISLQIKTVNRLTPHNPEFSDVTDLFMAYSESLSYKNREAVPEVISMINREFNSPVNYLDLTINDEQIIDTTHQFVIEILLSDDRILSDTTEPVRIY